MRAAAASACAAAASASRKRPASGAPGVPGHPHSEPQRTQGHLRTRRPQASGRRPRQERATWTWAGLAPAPPGLPPTRRSRQPSAASGSWHQRLPCGKLRKTVGLPTPSHPFLDAWGRRLLTALAHHPGCARRARPRPSGRRGAPSAGARPAVPVCSPHAPPRPPLPLSGRNPQGRTRRGITVRSRTQKDGRCGTARSHLSVHPEGSLPTGSRVTLNEHEAALSDGTVSENTRNDTTNMTQDGH